MYGGKPGNRWPAPGNEDEEVKQDGQTVRPTLNATIILMMATMNVKLGPIERILSKGEEKHTPYTGS